ncbi:unnamed protein product, partial [Mesorhabditis belari]|uniref:Uncharacterized protein n=1 Tax=Mesorhabditis belari TaxID=2138241 RepID=A0AAF3EFF0_9BILA
MPQFIRQIVEENRCCNNLGFFKVFVWGFFIINCAFGIYAIIDLFDNGGLLAWINVFGLLIVTAFIFGSLLDNRSFGKGFLWMGPIYYSFVIGLLITAAICCSKSECCDSIPNGFESLVKGVNVILVLVYFALEYFVMVIYIRLMKSGDYTTVKCFA